MPNVVQKTYFGSDTISIPRNVKYVIVTPFYENNSMSFSAALSFNFVGSNNTLYGMGSNTLGTLGDNTIIPKSSPILCASNIIFTKIISGGNYNLALNIFNEPYGWGENNIGQLGLSTITTTSFPSLIANTLLCNIRSEHNNNIAINNNGNIYSWPYVNAIQPGTTTSSPTLVVSSVRFCKILFGGTRSFVQDVDGNTYAFGVNSSGELGINSVTNASSPTLISGGYKFGKIFCNGSSTLGLTNDGNLYAWGLNSSGQLGNGSITNTSSPVLILTKVKDILSRSITFNNEPSTFFAITNNDSLYGWGLNTSGQLGDNTLTNKSSPTLIFSNIKVSKVFAGSNRTFVLDLNGNLYATGNNTDGALGVNDIAPRSTPTLVSASLKFVNLTQGPSTVMALGKNEVLYGWGTNTSGVLGTGDINPRSTPTMILSEFSAKSMPSVSSYVPQSGSQVIEVIPETTYRIVVGDTGCFFGNTPIADGVIEKIVVTYYQ